MGSAVWEFMWCIDKVTKIDNKGFGIVLGGKPIKLSDVGMGHDNTVSRNLAKLQKYGYIDVVRTPYGLRIKVCKAKKKFGRKGDTPILVNHHNPYILTKIGESPTNNGESPTGNGESNKTVQRQYIDNTKDKGVLKEPIKRNTGMRGIGDILNKKDL